MKKKTYFLLFIFIILPMTLLLISFVFWQNSQTYGTMLSLMQVKHNVVDVPNAPINNQNNLKPVHLTGQIQTADEVCDELLKVCFKALKVTRKVEMFQWDETITTSMVFRSGQLIKQMSYSYNQVWSEQLIDSSKFHDTKGHENPNRLFVESKTSFAPHIQIGDFVLAPKSYNYLTLDEKVPLTEANIGQLMMPGKNPQVHDGIILFSDNNSNTIGDLKIELKIMQPQQVSLVAQQKNNQLKPLSIRKGYKLFIIKPGIQLAEAMLNEQIGTIPNHDWFSWLRNSFRDETGF